MCKGARTFIANEMKWKMAISRRSTGTRKDAKDAANFHSGPMHSNRISIYHFECVRNRMPKFHCAFSASQLRRSPRHHARTLTPTMSESFISSRVRGFCVVPKAVPSPTQITLFRVIGSRLYTASNRFLRDWADVCARIRLCYLGRRRPRRRAIYFHRTSFMFMECAMCLERAHTAH